MAGFMHLSRVVWMATIPSPILEFRICETVKKAQGFRVGFGSGFCNRELVFELQIRVPNLERGFCLEKAIGPKDQLAPARLPTWSSWPAPDSPASHLHGHYAPVWSELRSENTLNAPFPWLCICRFLSKCSNSLIFYLLAPMYPSILSLRGIPLE